ncbi:Eukaryotic translation initiation factor 3 subunit K [Plecturocebus cupreus]
MAMFEQMRAKVGKLLKGINRYSLENLATLEHYLEMEANKNAYDLEANPAVLKLHVKKSGHLTDFYLRNLLETCHFQAFWQVLDESMDRLEGITGFEDSVQMFICPVVGITYQHINC